jgi:hypothetical protein
MAAPEDSPQGKLPRKINRPAPPPPPPPFNPPFFGEPLNPALPFKPTIFGPANQAPNTISAGAVQQTCQSPKHGYALSMG